MDRDEVEIVKLAALCKLADPPHCLGRLGFVGSQHTRLRNVDRHDVGMTIGDNLFYHTVVAPSCGSFRHRDTLMACSSGGLVRMLLLGFQGLDGR